MDGHQVKAWERQIFTILQDGLGEDCQLPGRTLRLMAKAAVVVIEAIEDEKELAKRPRK